MAFWGYSPKSKRGLGLSFGAYFLHDFRIKCALFNTLTMDKVSMSYLFSRSKYETKCVIKACARYFYQIFIFSPNDSSSKTMKNAFYII